MSQPLYVRNKKAYTLPDNVRQPSMYAKPEAACSVLGS